MYFFNSRQSLYSKKEKVQPKTIMCVGLPRGDREASPKKDSSSQSRFQDGKCVSISEASPNCNTAPKAKGYFSIKAFAGRFFTLRCRTIPPLQGSEWGLGWRRRIGFGKIPCAQKKRESSTQNDHVRRLAARRS